MKKIELIFSIFGDKSLKLLEKLNLYLSLKLLHQNVLI